MEEQQKKAGGGGFLKARLAVKQALKAAYNTGFEFNPIAVTGSVTESFSKITLSDTSSKASVSIPGTTEKKLSLKSKLKLSSAVLLVPTGQAESKTSLDHTEEVIY